MTNPGEINTDHLKFEMAEVALTRKPGDFLVTGMDPSLTGDQSAQLVNLMAVYTTPGTDGPRLKRLDLPRADLPADLVETLVSRYAKEEGEGVPALPHDLARMLSDSIESACTEIEDTEVVSPSYRMLGMLGIFTSDGERPLPIKYLNINFLMTLMSHMPGTSDPTAMTEESLQNIYSSISEHSEVPPFDEWKSNFQGITAEVLQGIGDIGVARAMAAMHLMLVPEEASHPTIESRLF